MTSPAMEVQGAIYDTLVADTDFGALAGDRIYDNVPEQAIFPYVMFGSHQQITDDAVCIISTEHFLNIDVW